MKLHRPRRILVVEDHPVAQQMLQHLFRSAGFVVDAAGDGLAAMQSFRAHEPCLVVLDLGLPLMDGREVCQRMKSISPSVPVLVLSATVGVRDKVHLLGLGADDYVTKPFDPPELLARARALLRRPASVSEVA